MTGLTRAAQLAAAGRILKDAGIQEPARDARVLQRWTSGLSGAAFSTALDEVMGPEETEAYRTAIEHRANNVPISHITGQRAFWQHVFKVSPDVLDPRPETEVLVAQALQLPFARVLDLGTGSGCILLSLLAERRDATGVGIDRCAKALDIARHNASRLSVADRCRLQTGDWLAGIDEKFDLIVSNPPYIAEREMETLSAEVLHHEPHIALTPGGDGLQAYRAIASRVSPVLSPKGHVLVEIGPTQAKAVTGYFANAGLSVMPPIRDLDGRDRVILAHS